MPKNAVLSNKDKENALKIKRIIPIIAIYAVMVALALVANFINPGFLSVGNIYSIVKQMAFLGIACIGQTLIILTGGIDLSLRNVILLANVLAAQMINGKPENTWTTFGFIMLVCVVIGVVNGAGVTFLKIPAMVMTLASGTVCYGATMLYCKGAPGGHASPILTFLANQKLFGAFNGVFFIWVALVVITIVVLKCTTFGRSIYAVGTNSEAARHAGINVPLVHIACYVIAAVMAGITGFLFLGFTESGYLSTAASYNMDSIAAVVIGGTSIMGGAGGYVGTIAGVGIMIVLDSLMTILHMAESGKQIFQGLLIVVLLVVVYSRKKKN